MKPNEFIAKIGEFARQDMQKSGILASLTIAQAILESGWGKYDCGGNNLFGIKGEYNGQFTNCPTKEFSNGQYFNTMGQFCKYPSWLESLQDHSDFIKSVHLSDGSLRYQAVIGETDYKKACHAIKNAGYATSPVYADSLISLIEQYHLNRFDGIVPQPVAEIKSVETIAKEVLAGKWGNGAYRKSSIEKAGYNYNAVQQKVNESCGQAKANTPVVPPAIAKPQLKSIAEIAKEVIRGNWGNGADRKNRLTKAGYNYADIQKQINK